jgi:ribosomal protein S18 acetylase RimI-like enzyme
MLIGLRRRCCFSSDIPILYNNMMRGGYILGEIILSRSSLVGDIYFIYVHDNLRRNGWATILCRLFERVVYDRGASVGLKVAIIRISMKQCIVNSTRFWNKQGFDGGKESAYLTKSINLK